MRIKDLPPLPVRGKGLRSPMTPLVPWIRLRVVYPKRREKIVLVEFMWHNSWWLWPSLNDFGKHAYRCMMRCYWLNRGKRARSTKGQSHALYAAAKWENFDK